MALSKFNPQPVDISAGYKMGSTLILSTGLAGVGKTTHLKEIAKIIPNCLYIDKDLINEAFLGAHTMQSDYYNQHVKMQTYAAMIKLALSHLSLGKVVIIDGGVGGKLTSVFKEYLDSKEFATKVIYFQCSGPTQFQRLTQRNAARDNDKKGAQFEPYRKKHIAEHLQELEQIPHLVIDTEDPAKLQENIQRIIKHIGQPRQPSLSKDPLSLFRTSRPVVMDIKDVKHCLRSHRLYKR